MQEKLTVVGSSMPCELTENMNSLIWQSLSCLRATAVVATAVCRLATRIRRLDAHGQQASGCERAPHLCGELIDPLIATPKPVDERRLRVAIVRDDHPVRQEQDAPMPL
jgi:hypothetical protein